MPDQFDVAQELDAYYRRQALAVWKRQQEKAEDPLQFCKDCGEEIPEGRRMAAPWCTRCTDCQQQWETANR
jgi:phage/conjugal plasmid C-4 type zinc finger TraR family protein